jgi:Uri superfamily endonuclease
MKGCYTLVLHLPTGIGLTVGKLGDFHFSAGYYLYFGSALNSLEGRLRRHLTREKKRHWHIDFLTSVAQLVQVWWTTQSKSLECSWAQRALEKASTSVLVPGFGSSDCRSCPAHLVHAPSWHEVQQMRERLELDSPGGLFISNGPGGSPVYWPENSASWNCLSLPVLVLYNWLA